MKRLTIKTDKMDALMKGLKALKSKDVLVGVPADKTTRSDDTAMNNATIAYINDQGSPIHNIPARPFMRPGIKSVQDKITARFKRAALAALDGRRSGVEEELMAAGLVAQNGIKDIITAGNFEPLALSTVRARAKRGSAGALAEIQSRDAGNAPNSENTRPLIDTGQLRNSISFVIRGKGKG